MDGVVACTSAGIGADYLDHYRKHGVQATFQGGEEHELTGHSFVAHTNYATTLGRGSTRVSSATPPPPFAH